MFFIRKPNFTIKETYPICVDFISNPAIKLYLSSLQGEVESYSHRYEELASSGRLNEFTVPTIFDDQVNPNNEWLKKLYKNYLSVKNNSKYAEAYKFYNSIKNYETYQKIRRCTYCNHSMVQALDHFLPESIFKALAVNPINLVPSCDFCNETKWTYKPDNLQPNSVLIHPYFDNVMDLDWLKVKIKTTHIFKVNPDVINGFKNFNFVYLNNSSMHNFLSLEVYKYSKKMIHTIFYVNNQISKSNGLLFDRINLTFDKTGLQTTFSFAADDFFQTEIIPNLQYGMYSDKSDEDLRNLFSMKARILCSQGYNKNHWKIALYNFLSQYNCSFKNLY
ncbi:hypothetical protein AS4_06360 [Acinetobacter guillouiae]|uniref:hypothetical protein n=1 Tax=Acinetobacter guillouiae TaxID=106649 RepID=UPI0004EF6491|nr:hypothetical protein [Acinetobacter guillouiae]BAP35576.1 hypothetical protein AS4_06360 [Acinetobacter guillouiae]